MGKRWWPQKKRCWNCWWNMKLRWTSSNLKKDVQHQKSIFCFFCCHFFESCQGALVCYSSKFFPIFVHKKPPYRNIGCISRKRIGPLRLFDEHLRMQLIRKSKLSIISCLAQNDQVWKIRTGHLWASRFVPDLWECYQNRHMSFWRIFVVW